MIRIGIFIGNMQGGGAERIVLYLVNNLDRKIFKPYLILLNMIGPYLNMVQDDVDIILLNANCSLGGTFRLARELKVVIKKNKLDIINSHMTLYNRAILRALSLYPFLKIPIVLSEHNNFSYRMSRKNAAINYLKKLEIAVLYRNKRIICVSEGIKNDIVRAIGINENSISVIHNPIILSDISKRQYDKPELIIRNKNEFIIVSVGRLHFQKGFDNLIKAFKQVLGKIPNVKLYIIGEGAERENLMKLIYELELIDFVFMPGFTKNPWTEIKQADLFVLSSRSEGFGNVIIEAMACKTPVLSVNCDFGPSEIIENEKTGELVANENIALLSDSIVNLLNDKEKLNLYSQNAFDNISRYDISLFIEKYQSSFFQSRIYK